MDNNDNMDDRKQIICESASSLFTIHFSATTIPLFFEPALQRSPPGNTQRTGRSCATACVR